jgi:tetratricopeptide (TPR) repeat protein
MPGRFSSCRRALNVLGKYPEAEKPYKPALAIFEKARPSAATTRDLAKTLNGLGRVYEHEGRYAEAEVQKRALSTVESLLTLDQMVVSHALEDLGKMPITGKAVTPRREDYFKRTLVIREKAPSGDHRGEPDAQSLSNVYMRTGRFAEAETALKRALDIQERPSAQGIRMSQRVLTNLAELYRLTGRYALAEPLQKRALNIQEDARS